LFEHRAKQNNENEAGYLLLEVLIGVAISSTLIYLLLASLNSLSRSQDRTLQVVEDISDRVFTRNLTNKVFASIKPTYRSEEGGFEGRRNGFNGRSYLDGVAGLGGADIDVSLVSDGPRTRLVMTSEDGAYTLMTIEGRNCRFEYQPPEGGFLATWQDTSGTENVRDGSAPNARYLRYARPVPRQVRLFCTTNRREQLVGAWPLGANDWPAPRESDLQGALPF